MSEAVELERSAPTPNESTCMLSRPAKTPDALFGVCWDSSDEAARRALALGLWRCCVSAVASVPGAGLLAEQDLMSMLESHTDSPVSPPDGKLNLLLTGAEQSYLRDAAAARAVLQDLAGHGRAETAPLGASGTIAPGTVGRDDAEVLAARRLSSDQPLGRIPSQSLQKRMSARGSDSGFVEGGLVAMHADAAKEFSITFGDDMEASRITTDSLPRHPIIETDKVRRGEDMDGNKTVNQYSVIGDLGRGSYAKVKLVLHNETDEPFALKILNKSLLSRIAKASSGSALAQAKVEIAVMKKLAHPRVVRLHEVIDDPTADKMYLIMDYVPGGQLLQLSNTGTCDPLPREKAARYARDIASGLGYLHRHHIIHRDVKPANILLDAQDSCVLCDFGVSVFVAGDAEEDDVIEGLEGTPYFLSPEICRGDGEVHGKVADVWALGVTIFVMVFGRVCWQGVEKAEIMDRIQNDALEMPATGVDSVLRDLFKRILNKDPRRRMTVDQFKKHPFVQSADGKRRASLPGQATDVQLSREDIIGAVQLGSNVTPTTRRAPAGGAFDSLTAQQLAAARQAAPPAPAAAAPASAGDASVVSYHAPLRRMVPRHGCPGDFDSSSESDGEYGGVGGGTDTSNPAFGRTQPAGAKLPSLASDD
eukprot:TRINITY_DN2953_c1_g2_i1.p1 TRINITY_DN2953_c1_g2~~TRINITY_DN2953_c1_g2_i1.p1  ORF type:complete len:743 (+),score=215.90 TRINITY_DN2953_c1_g2_i1:284-2230(+)